MSATLLRRAIERRATNWEAMKGLLETSESEGRDLSGEEQTEFDRLETVIEEDTRQIERYESAARRSREFDTVPPAPGPGDPTPEPTRTRDEEYDDVFWSFVRRGVDGLTGEQRQLLQAHYVADGESRAQTTTTTGGGYLVPPGYLARVTDAMKAYGAMLDVAEIIRTDSGQPMQWPTADDTGNKGAILAENTQVTEQDATFGTKTLDAYMYTSKLIRVPFQLLDDAAFDIEAWLASKQGERIGRILNEHFTTGTGTSQPDGLITSATSGVTAASTTAIAYAELIDLEHSIDPAYRGNARYMFADTTFKAFRKLLDGDNRPLWQPSLQAGAPSVFNGREYVINQDMAAPAASAVTVAFGDFRAAYTIRLVNGMRNLRLTERYADYLQVGMLAFQRADGTLNDSKAVRTLTQAAA